MKWVGAAIFTDCGPVKEMIRWAVGNYSPAVNTLCVCVCVCVCVSVYVPLCLGSGGWGVKKLCICLYIFSY